MTAPVSDAWKCGECGGDVRCEGGTYRRDLDGEILGLEEGYHCENGHSGKIVEDADGEIHSIEGLVQR